jgi:hypothetical protein
MSQPKFLCSFSHPTTWKIIFDTIIKELGPKFYEWNKGLGFEEDETVLVIHHLSGRKIRVLLRNISILQPAVVGGWFTVLREATKAEFVMQFKRFEDDIAYDCHTLRAKVSRSEAGKKILSIGPKLMAELSDHLKAWRPPNEVTAISDEVKYGWGILLSWMCEEHSLDRMGIAQNDFPSWVRWTADQASPVP